MRFEDLGKKSVIKINDEGVVQFCDHKIVGNEQTYVVKRTCNDGDGFTSREIIYYPNKSTAKVNDLRYRYIDIDGKKKLSCVFVKDIVETYQELKNNPDDEEPVNSRVQTLTYDEKGRLLSYHKDSKCVEYMYKDYDDVIYSISDATYSISEITKNFGLISQSTTQYYNNQNMCLVEETCHYEVVHHTLPDLKPIYKISEKIVKRYNLYDKGYILTTVNYNNGTTIVDEYKEEPDGTFIRISRETNIQGISEESIYNSENLDDDIWERTFSERQVFDRGEPVATILETIDDAKSIKKIMINRFENEEFEFEDSRCRKEQNYQVRNILYTKYDYQADDGSYFIRLLVYNNQDNQKYPIVSFTINIKNKLTKGQFDDMINKASKLLDLLGFDNYLSSNISVRHGNNYIMIHNINNFDKNNSRCSNTEVTFDTDDGVLYMRCEDYKHDVNYSYSNNEWSEEIRFAASDEQYQKMTKYADALFIKSILDDSVDKSSFRFYNELAMDIRNLIPVEREE